VIDPAQIPDEVVEAAAMAAWNTQREHWGLYKVMLETEGHLPPYEKLGSGKQRELLVEARAAIAAAINAWPGMTHMEPDLANGIIILPLPQQASDD